MIIKLHPVTINTSIYMLLFYFVVAILRVLVLLQERCSTV